MNEFGSPMRSADLRARAERAEAALAQAYEMAGLLEDRLRMALLAQIGIASSGTPLAEMSPEGVVTVQALPHSDGSSRIYGSTVATSTVGASEAVLLTAPRGAGEVQLFEEGLIWARVRDEREALFTAALDPAYDFRFNELFVPVLSGAQVQVSIEGPRGGFTTPWLSASRLFRFAAPIVGNGRLSINSRSRSGSSDGRFVHMMGGISLRRSSPVREGRAVAVFDAPSSGTLSIARVEEADTNRPITPESVRRGGSVVNPLGFSVTAGDRIELTLPITFDRPLSRVRIFTDSL